MARTTLLLFRSSILRSVDGFHLPPFPTLGSFRRALTPRPPDACTLISRDLLTREGGGLILHVRTERAALEAWLVFVLPAHSFPPIFKCRSVSSSADLTKDLADFCLSIQVAVPAAVAR